MGLMSNREKPWNLLLGKTCRYHVILPIVSALFAERYEVMVVDDATIRSFFVRYLACESINVRRVLRPPIGIMDIRGGERRRTYTRMHRMHRRYRI